ncbi:hypothetical protein BKA63DRAFT_571251 [Paraphoma chrysanthemicola]|nr:hypothetical protein BKA63DRAFT_571251 [Paraphoma chrysanthemicola]
MRNESDTNLDYSKTLPNELGWCLREVIQPYRHLPNNQTTLPEPLPTISPPIADTAESGQQDLAYPHDHAPTNFITSVATMPSYELRSFAEKSKMAGGGQITAKLMVQILTSYPGMLRDPNSPPPFIHHSSMKSLPGCETRATESLSTCTSLMQLLGSGTPGSRRLVWKNIRLECERLYVDWMNPDKWELLSSMQALLIYMMLRLQDGENTHNNFDVLLLSAMWVVACSMNHKIGNLECGSPTGLSYGNTYDDWIFEESRRRLAITFRTIGMLFSTEPASGCSLDSSFLLAPLPASKLLWDAPSEAQWLVEKNRDRRGESVFGIRMGGAMVKLDRSEDTFTRYGLNAGQMEEEKSKSSANWAEWCAGMDGLGALVMLAASLPV